MVFGEKYESGHKNRGKLARRRKDDGKRAVKG
jgi:hypothetical protein